MSELLAPFDEPPDAIDETDETDEIDGVDEITDKPAELSDVRTPVLVTEQEVLLGTAAAGAPPAKSSRRWTQVIGAALRAIVTWEPADVRAQRPNDFLESSRMAREMHRL